MSERKWTKGPWEAMGDNGKYFTKHGWSVDHESASCFMTFPVHRGGYVIAMVVDADGDDDQFEANGRLIAAAPDLYEALKAVVRVAGRDTDEFAKARAALQRAEGES